MATAKSGALAGAIMGGLLQLQRIVEGKRGLKSPRMKWKDRRTNSQVAWADSSGAATS